MSSQVALRKESVDRNIKAVVSYNIKETSLSARRAWIEIKCRYLPGYNQKVALRKESVDRNRSTHKTSWYACSSLSARRAWIEIFLQRDIHPWLRVALRKESVDRNSKGMMVAVDGRLVALRKESVDRNVPALRSCTHYDRRSPQGERG